MVKIDDEYLINATDSCYTLEFRNTVKNRDSKNYGKETRSIQGYYTSIEKTLMGYIRFKTRKFVASEQLDDIKILIEKINEIEEYLKENFKGV